MQLWSDDDETEQVFPGENVKLKLKNVEEEVITIFAFSQIANMMADYMNSICWFIWLYLLDGIAEF